MDKELILDQFLPYRLSRLQRTVSMTFSAEYDKKFGLSVPEWRVIAVLGRSPGLSAVEVAEQTFLDKVAVSRAVTKLIQAGRVEREFADADRRRSILNLSSKGHEVHDGIAAHGLDFEQNLLHGLDDGEIEQLNTVMDRLLDRAREL